MSVIIDAIDKKNLKKNLPDFRAGDTVSVDVKVKEGEKERIQNYAGVVIQRRGQGIGETFTVRKISQNISVERIFPLHSPNIGEIKVTNEGRVRRARIFYIRDLKGKAARIKSRKRQSN